MLKDKTTVIWDEEIIRRGGFVEFTISLKSMETFKKCKAIVTRVKEDELLLHTVALDSENIGSYPGVVKADKSNKIKIFYPADTLYYDMSDLKILVY
jgi:hypothetical protein